eukprot:scaffold34915_cov180-Amphora_coffeaeformis.AAC.7
MGNQNIYHCCHVMLNNCPRTLDTRRDDDHPHEIDKEIKDRYAKEQIEKVSRPSEERPFVWFPSAQLGSGPPPIIVYDVYEPEPNAAAADVNAERVLLATCQWLPLLPVAPEKMSCRRCRSACPGAGGS